MMAKAAEGFGLGLREASETCARLLNVHRTLDEHALALSDI